MSGGDSTSRTTTNGRQKYGTSLHCEHAGSELHIASSMVSIHFGLPCSRKQRQLKEYLMPRRPNTPHSPREYQWAKEPVGSIIRDPLHEAMLMRVSVETSSALSDTERSARHRCASRAMHPSTSFSPRSGMQSTMGDFTSIAQLSFYSLMLGLSSG